MDTRHKRILTISLLVLTVVSGFALRTVMNVDQAQTEDGDFLLSGNDPYYHKHAVDQIVEDWEHHGFDPMLDYPTGQTNPNPPLYEWSIAIGSEVFEPFTGSTDEAVWWSTLMSPAIWGALTIVPVFLIARLFAGDWAGLLAAFLLATAPEHMSRTSLGFADHEALVFFFVTSGFYALLTAIRSTGAPTDRRRFRQIPSSFREWVFEDRRASGSAVVAGASFGAIALAWKGFPYVFGVVLAYAGLQYLVNHYQDKDVARPFFIIGTALTVAVLIALPYYLSFGLMHFWYPAFYLVLALAAFSLYFIAVQRYPSVLVIPGLLVLLGIFATFMFFVFPDISRALLSRLVYFRSNLLYETIAEARPAGLSELSFAVGPIPFFMFVGGIVALGWQVWQDQQPAFLFFFAWALIDFVMGISAIRFLSLIAPTIAILSAVATIWLLDMVDLPSLTEAYRRTGGRVFRAFNPLYGVVGAVLAIIVAGLVVAGGLAFYILAGVLVYGYFQFLVNDSLGLNAGRNAIYISIVLFLGLLVIGPNAALGMDAAVPAGYENERVEQARSQAMEDVLQTADEIGLDEEAKGELESAVQDSRNKEDFRTALEDASIRLGFSDETTDRLYEAGEDEFSTITFYSMRMGAFGQSFLTPGWHDALTWLSNQDTDQPPAERPAQVAWWDYGHWTISEGNHPAVADNFQNGYQAAGQWLVSQNETAAIQMMGARQASYFAQQDDLDTYKQTLVDAGIDESNVDDLVEDLRGAPYPFIEFADDPEENEERSVEWVASLEEISGKSIRYGTADNRMLPVDDPQTPRIERPSIFYAPVTLAEEDPDDFVETITVDMDSGEELSEEEIRQLQQQSDPENQPNIGRQLQYKEAFFESMYYKAFMGLPVKEPQSFRGQEIPQPFSLQGFEEFYRSGENRLIGEGPVTGTALLRQPAAPGFGLDHHRLVEANQAVRILKYYPGAVVEGEVTIDGEPADGLRITAFDDAGELVLNATRSASGQQQNATDWDVPHDSTTASANGAYELVAPFATTNRGIEIRVTQNEATSSGPSLFGGGGTTFTIANETLDVSQQDAEERSEYTVDFEIEPATVTGTAYHDANGNGTQDAGEDPIRNATVTVADETVQTGPDGSFEVTGITPGKRSISAEAEGYQLVGSPQVELASGAEVTRNLSFEFEPVPINATVQDEQGSGVAGIQTQFNATEDSETAQSKQAISRRNGTLAERGPRGRPQALSLQPGEYAISGNGTDPRTDTEYEITGFAVTGGTGASKNDEGDLVVEPEAENVDLTIRAEERAASS